MLAEIHIPRSRLMHDTLDVLIFPQCSLSTSIYDRLICDEAAIGYHRASGHADAVDEEGLEDKSVCRGGSALVAARRCSMTELDQKPTNIRQLATRGAQAAIQALESNNTCPTTLSRRFHKYAVQTARPFDADTLDRMAWKLLNTFNTWLLDNNVYHVRRLCQVLCCTASCTSDRQSYVS